MGTVQLTLWSSLASLLQEFQYSLCNKKFCGTDVNGVTPAQLLLIMAESDGEAIAGVLAIGLHIPAPSPLLKYFLYLSRSWNNNILLYFPPFINFLAEWAWF